MPSYKTKNLEFSDAAITEKIRLLVLWPVADGVACDIGARRWHPHVHAMLPEDDDESPLAKCHDILMCRGGWKSNPSHAHEPIMIHPQDPNKIRLLCIVVGIDANGPGLVFGKPCRSPSCPDGSFFFGWVKKDLDVCGFVGG